MAQNKEATSKAGARVVSTGKAASARRRACPSHLGHVRPADADERVAEAAEASLETALGAIANYTPRSVTNWNEPVATFVREQATRLVTEYGKTSAITKYLLVLAHLAAFCSGRTSTLKLAEVVHPRTFEQFAKAGAKTLSANTINTYRSHLRAIGPLLNPRADWPTSTRVGGRTLAVPYSAAEVKKIFTWLDLFQNRARTAALIVILLALGAGLKPAETVRLRRRDIVARGEVWCVVLPDRTVPILGSYVPGVLGAIKDFAPDDRLTGEHEGRNRANEILASLWIPHDGEPINAGRLRNTWLLAHLINGTRLPVLLEGAGMSGATSLGDLLEFVPVTNTAAAQQQARVMMRDAG